jgi:hypothetical protein
MFQPMAREDGDSPAVAQMRKKYCVKKTIVEETQNCSILQQCGQHCQRLGVIINALAGRAHGFKQILL